MLYKIYGYIYECIYIHCYHPACWSFHRFTRWRRRCANDFLLFRSCLIHHWTVHCTQQINNFHSIICWIKLICFWLHFHFTVYLLNAFPYYCLWSYLGEVEFDPLCKHFLSFSLTATYHDMSPPIRMTWFYVMLYVAASFCVFFLFLLLFFFLFSFLSSSLSLLANVALSVSVQQIMQ